MVVKGISVRLSRGTSEGVHLAGSCRARYGEMLQDRLTWSFHCFSLKLRYLDLQLAMLVSTDGSAEITSSWVDSGLYQVVSRSISLAWCGERWEKPHGQRQENRFIAFRGKFIFFLY